MPTPISTMHPSSPLAEKSPQTYPDGLTAREVEVLRLVAQGLADAQIADQLIILPPFWIEYPVHLILEQVARPNALPEEYRHVYVT